MANARMISRDFFTSADLVDLPAPARLLFAGMIVFADDSGVIRDNVTFFQRTLLCGIDVRPCRVRSWTDALAMRHCIESVFLEGVKCWKITNFFRFQRLKRREGKRREGEGEGNARPSRAQKGTDPARKPPDRSAPPTNPSRNFPQPPQGLATSAFEGPEDPFLRLVEEWQMPAVHLELVARRHRERPRTPEDVADWRRALAQGKDLKAQGRLRLENVQTFLRKRMVVFANPKDASDIDWLDQGDYGLANMPREARQEFNTQEALRLLRERDNGLE